MSEGMSQAAFARLMNWRPSYVTQLKREGRLVFTDDGKVDAEKSRARIKATSDPTKQGVAARHKKTRRAPPPRDDQVDDELELEDDAGTGAASYQDNRRQLEYWKSQTARLEFMRLSGELVEARAVERAAAAAGNLVRTALENFPDQVVAELVAETDHGRAHALLTERLEAVLASLVGELDNVVESIK